MSCILQCVALDERGDQLAIGDMSGRINIFHGVAEGLAELHTSNIHRKLHAQTTLHWHAHPVGAVCFGMDGAYLISGGKEAVLVSAELGLLHSTKLLAAALLVCACSIQSEKHWD
jgi:NET1-associated nuclear protein 1 (U3 small nucleolar RNA-associated protein 17)